MIACGHCWCIKLWYLDIWVWVWNTPQLIQQLSAWKLQEFGTFSDTSDDASVQTCFNCCQRSLSLSKYTCHCCPQFQQCCPCWPLTSSRVIAQQGDVLYPTTDLRMVRLLCWRRTRVTKANGNPKLMRFFFKICIKKSSYTIHRFKYWSLWGCIETPDHKWCTWTDVQFYWSGDQHFKALVLSVLLCPLTPGNPDVFCPTRQKTVCLLSDQWDSIKCRQCCYAMLVTKIKVDEEMSYWHYKS